MRRNKQILSFPNFLFDSASQIESRTYNEFIKSQFKAKLIHEKAYFKMDLNTEMYSMQLIVFIINDSNENQCHIWSQQKALLMNAEKISFRFQHLIILINLKRHTSLNEELFSFLIDNIYLCFFSCLQRLKKKGIYSTELNNILKRMLMQKKGLRHCEKLIQYIFFRSNSFNENIKLHSNGGKPYLYLSDFQDNLIVYTRGDCMPLAPEMQAIFLDKEEEFDMYILSKQKCFNLHFVKLNDFIIYLAQQHLNEQVLSYDNIKLLFLKELKGKVKTITFEESPEQESDQLFWFSLDSYSEQLLEVIVALNNCSLSEKFLQSATICINLNHKDVKYLFKCQRSHSKIPQISTEIYQQAFEMVCNTDS